LAYAHAVGRDLAAGDFLDAAENVSGVITIPAVVADTDGHVFEDHKRVLVFEDLSFHNSFANCSIAVFAAIPVTVFHDSGSATR
jgi:hypothetical protein